MNDMSCQPCGCDKGANWVCEQHRGMTATSSQASVYVAEPIPTSIGAPNRASILPETGAARKTYPIATGFLDYFPDAVSEVSHVSWKGNDQHNPGQPTHWDRSKSTDEADTLMRHFLQRGSRDTDGLRHSAKVAWRALALLQKEIEHDRQ